MKEKEKEMEVIFFTNDKGVSIGQRMGWVWFCF
jgi:hypothetical protein